MNGPQKVYRETCEHCQYKDLPMDVMVVLPVLHTTVRTSADTGFTITSLAIHPDFSEKCATRKMQRNIRYMAAEKNKRLP